MTRLRSAYLLPGIALVLLGTLLGTQLDAFTSDPDALQQLRKLEQSYLIINQQYVDQVPSKNVAEEGIEGMLRELDPHSSFIPAEEVRDVQDNYRGKFGGIGIVFEIVEDAAVDGRVARVISPIADGPSEQVGVMAGDRIVAIEDSTAVGSTDRQIQARLKGPVGTEVTMTVYRPSTEQRIPFTITRDEIPYYSITSAYLLDDGMTGYIKIDRFAMTTYDEFRDKMARLREEGMQRLVLDLRGNPGGILKAAVDISDELLGEGRVIVETRGRKEAMSNRFRSTRRGGFEQQPVMVLVSRRSASASEIVAGALQDHDRALIVGQRTFGKGLVQKQFELNDGSLLQMTVSRYYTPAGRLIQTPYEDGDLEDYYARKFGDDFTASVFDPSAYKDSIPDSLKRETAHGRVVFGGGGIMPDYVVQPDTTDLALRLTSSGVDFLFTSRWFYDHEEELRSTWRDRQDAFVADYAVPTAVLDSFWAFIGEHGFSLVDDPAQMAPSEGVYTYAQAEANEDVLALRMKAYLARQLYGSSAMRPIYNQADPVIQEALTLWDRAQMLAAYHGFADSAPARTDYNDGR